MYENKLCLLLSFIIIVSCSSKEAERKPIIYPRESTEVSTTKPKVTSITAKQVASEQGSNFVTEIKFPKKKDIISDQDQMKIKKMYEKAQRVGKIQEVQLIIWADKEFPTKENQKLSKEQQVLVDDRNDSLANLIGQLDKKIKIKKISMAQRASTLEKFTASDEAEVKESLEMSDAPGKMSGAIVIFILDEKSF